MFACNDTHSALSTRRHALTHGLDIQAVILSRVHDGLPRLDFELYILWNEFHFHRTTPQSCGDEKFRELLLTDFYDHFLAVFEIKGGFDRCHFLAGDFYRVGLK